jgi:hypothetical protein
LIPVLEVGHSQDHLSIEELLLGDHGIHDVLDLRSGVPGLLSVRVRGHDARVELESFTQVLRRVVRRMGRRILLASLSKSSVVSVVSHVCFSDLPASGTQGSERDPNQVRLKPYCFIRKFPAKTNLS